MPSKVTKIIYSITLLFVSLWIWMLLYNAQFLSYDDNYGHIINAFLISIFSTMIMVVVWFKQRHFIQAYKWQTLTFLLISSPPTIAIVATNSTAIFGAILKN